MKSLHSILAVIVAGVALLAVTAIAQNDHQSGPMHHGMHHEFMGGPGEMGFGMFLHQLDLSDDQHAQIKQIFQSERPNLKPLMEQEAQAHQRMIQLITSGSFDQTKAAALAAQESQTHAQMEVEHAKIASQIYQLLSSDQKAKVADMIAKHQQHMLEENKEAAPDQQ